MRFSSLIPFVLPLSALAAPAILHRQDDPPQILSAVELGINLAVAAMNRAIGIPPPADQFPDVSSLQANLAVIPLARAMDNIRTAVGSGVNPNVRDLDIIRNSLDERSRQANILSSGCDRTANRNLCTAFDQAINGIASALGAIIALGAGSTPI